RHTQTLTPRHEHLHRTTPPRRQDTTRSQPLPQALPRPQPLPTPRTPTHDRLTFIEASLAQSRISTSGSSLGQRPALVRAALVVAPLRIVHVEGKARDSPSESARSPREPAPEPWG